MSKRPCGVKHSDAIKRGLAAKKIRTNGIKRLTKERDAAMAEVERLRRLLNECREMLDIVHLQTGWRYLKYEVDDALSAQPAATGEGEP